MSVKKIPEAFVLTCDICTREVTDPHKDRPLYWGYLIADLKTYNFQYETATKVLCPSCIEKLLKQIDERILNERHK